MRFKSFRRLGQTLFRFMIMWENFTDAYDAKVPTVSNSKLVQIKRCTYVILYTIQSFGFFIWKTVFIFAVFTLRPFIT